MATEIERKYLVKKLPRAPAEEIHIRQGYLMICESGAEIRIRDFGGTYVQTIKSAGSVVREEIEMQLTKEQFTYLWPFTEGHRIEKTRLLHKEKGYTYEIDIFKNLKDDLMIAEIEFDSNEDSKKFTPPGWLGEEITGNNRFKNQQLAT